MGRILVLVGFVIGLAGCTAANSDPAATAPTPFTSLAPATTTRPSATPATAATVPPVSLSTDGLSDAGIPADFDVGPVWDSVVLFELPRYSFQLWFVDGLVIVDNNGRALGHVPGPPPAPQDLSKRLVDVTKSAQEDRRTIPEGCLVDDSPGGGQLRLLCTSIDEGSERGPTVEVLLPDGTRQLVAELPPPPDELAGAYRSGRFLRVFPQPGRRGIALAQFSAECETRLAVFVADGTTYRFDGTSWWDDSFPDGESVALGWMGDRALIWRFNGPCATELATPGVYAYTTDGIGELLFDTPAAVQWVELLETEPAADTALYPDLGPTAREQLIASVGELPDALDIVTSFAKDVLRLGSPTVLSVTESTDAETFTITDGSLTVDVRVGVFGWNGSGNPIIGITYASTFDTAQEWYLTANVGNATGQWTAEFSFAVIGDEAEVTYASGDWSVTATTSDGQVLLELPHEPTETPRLTITFTKGGAVVGFHGTLLPAGAFAAG
ncbi:MAG TPA: hypothetical protein ENG98_02145 [Actinobacteria bacterium]|nr:hypothetical protein BMS3Bbin02_01269 [bacterium BMS3Bbin02]HDL41801.1 hypothetical protein [Actinomycetota bacterium]